MKEKEHLPLFGVGPVIIGVQIVITITGIIISYHGYFDFGKIELLNIPLKIIGIGLIAFGIYLNYSAKRKSKLFDMVTENKLIQTGVSAMPTGSQDKLAQLSVIRLVAEAIFLRYIHSKGVFCLWQKKSITLSVICQRC